MKQFMITLAAVFAGLLLFFVGIPFLLIMAAASAAAPAPMPGKTVLSLDLRTGLTDQEPQNPFASFKGRSLAVLTVADVLRKAETDDKVKGVLIRLPEAGVAPGAADELRLAIRHFRATGKPIWAHSQGLYQAGIATSTYEIAAAADQVWMQPGASFQATGVANEDIFFKRFFDKYGVKAEYEQRYEYKNAVNPYLYSDYTPAHRESELSWMGSVYGSALAAAAQDRGKDPAALKTIVEAGPYDAATAQAKGLVDQIGQVKDAQNALLAKAGGGAKLVDFNDYAAAAKRVEEAATVGKPAIAVIGAEGDIVTGSSDQGSTFGGGSTIYSDDISKALYDAAEDKDVKAVVLRVSSPGGSDTASEQIGAAVRAVKAAGKPVVVSMGTYAASGGYWISTDASYIVSQPSTLTGSIGVFGGKFALGDALGRFGVDVKQLSVGGDYAGAYGMGQGFSPSQRAAFSAEIDKIYAGFINRVATGRKLDPNRVREIAKGRVWTGVQAKQLGLVDELGGFYQAVDKAKALAGLDGKDVRFKMLPGKKSVFEALGQAFGMTQASVRTLAAAAWVMGDPRAQAMMDQMAAARLREQGAHVLAPTPVH